MNEANIRNIAIIAQVDVARRLGEPVDGNSLFGTQRFQYLRNGETPVSPTPFPSTCEKTE